MDWVPTLIDRPGPIYRRIVEALSADIATGRLHRGQQLPTHRALATALRIDLTTVTRAYAEARRAGLTEARVGQGTFVAESMAHIRHGARPRDEFDLSMNLPPQPLEADLEGRVTRGIAADPAGGRVLHPSQLSGARRQRGRTQHRSSVAAFPSGRCAWRAYCDLSGHSKRVVQYTCSAYEAG